MPSTYDRFHLVSDFEPRGDQERAISELIDGLNRGDRHQVLLGVTGSGKTFTMAQVVTAVNRPTLVMAHNKTLAAQLYQEFKRFFPDNAVEYFVSYYDYYQPEAYMPATDSYIEKEATINDEIDRLRLSATRALFERRDVLIVASVSCIYGLGSPEAYYGMLLALERGQRMDRDDILRKLVEIQYERNDHEFARGVFRVRGDIIEVYPSYDEQAVRIEMFGDEVDELLSFDPLTGRAHQRHDRIAVYPKSHFVMPREHTVQAVDAIKAELVERRTELEQLGKLLEAQRLHQRTMFDLEMMKEIGYCHGIENYSRHLSGRAAGEPPPTLLDYFPADALTIIDESHQTVPQVRGMYHGDRARKDVLVEYGFRLPSAIDNRPLTFDEWKGRVGQVVFVSATPGPYELERSGGVVVEQIIRPTGLVDSGGRRPSRERSGRRSAARNPAARGSARARAGDDAHQAHGGRPDAVLPGARRAGPVPALGHRHAGTGRDTARPPAGRLRRAGRNQPAPGRTGPAGGVACRHPRCRQGGLLAVRRISHPDRGSRRAKRERVRGDVCRHGDRVDAGGPDRDGPAAGTAGGLQPRARDHAGLGHQGHRRRPVERVRARLRHCSHRRADGPGLSYAGGARRAHRGALQAEMRAAAANLEFERAAVLRDQVRELRKLEIGVGGA